MSITNVQIDSMTLGSESFRDISGVQPRIFWALLTFGTHDKGCNFSRRYKIFASLTVSILKPFFIMSLISNSIIARYVFVNGFFYNKYQNQRELKLKNF